MQCLLEQRCHCGGLEAILARLEPPAPPKEVRSKALWEAGRLKETCQQDTNTLLVAVSAPDLALCPIPEMLGSGGRPEESSASFLSS